MKLSAKNCFDWKQVKVNHQKESSEATERVVDSSAVLAAVNVGARADRAGAVWVDGQALEGGIERAPADVLYFN